MTNSITDAFAEIGAMLQKQREYTLQLEQEVDMLRAKLAMHEAGNGAIVEIEGQRFALTPFKPTIVDSTHMPVAVVPDFDLHEKLNGSFLLDTGAVQAIAKLNEKAS